MHLLSRYASLVVITLLVVASLSALFAVPVARAQKKVVLYTHGWWQPPPQRRYNPFAPGAIIPGSLVYERLAFWMKMTDEYVPELATSWELKKDQGVVIVHLRKGVYWHDGQPFTCKDVWTTFMIYKAMNRPVWKYISDVKCLDDYTVEFKVKKWAYLLLHYLLFRDGRIVGPYHIYGKFAERIAKGEDPKTVLKDLIKFEPKTIIGTGPFRFVKITPSEVILEKFDKYWAADKVMIDEIVMPYITSNQVGWDYYRAGKLDYDVFMMPPEVMNELLKKPFAMIVKIYDLSGFALVFNFNNKWLQKREVRMAIAYAIDRKKVADAAGAGLFDPVEYPTGLLKLSSDWISDLISAGVLNKYEYNPTKAAQLLESVGFTKKDGKWYTPDGKPFKLTLIAPGGWTDWVSAMQEVANELKAFGIEVELRTPESPSYWSDQWYLGGHYDIAIDFFGAWMIYPWAAFERMWVEVNNRPRTVVQGANFPTELYLPYFKEKVDVKKLVEVLATSFDRKAQREAAMKLAYAANYYLPEYPIAEKRLVIFANKEHFIWPDPSIKPNYMLWQNAAGGHLDALAFMIRIGAVVPNPKYWGVTVTMPPKTITVPKVTTTVKTVVQTKTAPGTASTVTVTKTTTTTSVSVSTVTTTKTVTKTGWGAVAALFIIGLLIGIGIGYVLKRGS